MIKPLARLAVVVFALASAIWLLPATVAIAAWPPGNPSRVAYLLPLSYFWLMLAAVTAAVAAGAWRWQARGGAIEDLARRLWPLAALILWLVPFGPWLADRSPALLALAGPLRWIVAAAAIGATLTFGSKRRAVSGFVKPRRSVLFAAAFALYALMGVRFAEQVGFNGDEPHYLVIAHSLLADHDLDIANNHERRDYSAFFGGTLHPDFLRRGRHQEVYSIHAPGLPALLVPAYAAGGALGAVVFVALLAATASVAMFEVGAQLAGPLIGVTTWLTVCFSIPFIPHAWLIYPETAAALIVAVGVWRLWQPGADSVIGCAGYGVLLAVLPWLHTKFIVLLALFAAFETVRLWPRWRQLLAFLLPIGALSAAWLLSFYLMYGVFDPQAPYGATARTLVTSANIPHSLLGLLFDQKFGLLVFSPVYALAVPGAWLLWRDPENRWRAAAMIGAVTVFTLTTARFYMWWGGSSAPARFLVPAVPLLVPLTAAAMARLDGRIGRALTVSAALFTLGAAWIAAGSPHERLMYSDPHAVSSLISAIQGPAPLTAMMPTFTEENWHAPLSTLLVWLAIVTIAGVAAAALLRIHLLRASSAALATAVVILAGSGIAAGKVTTAERRAAVRDGQLALLRAYDPSRFHAIDASRGARLDPAAFRTLTAVEAAAARESPGPPAVELPEGKYEATVWFAGSGNGPLQILATGGAVLASTDLRGANPVTVNFEMPVNAPVEARLAGNVEVTRAVITPTVVVPASQRIIEHAGFVEPIGQDRVRGLLAYADGQSYPEGGVYWTRGTARATTVVVTTNATRLKLILHVGANAGAVEVEAGGKRFTLDMQANETREVMVELGGVPTRTVISVRVSRAFVPAESEKGNDDRRRLGCQVRPVLF